MDPVKDIIKSDEELNEREEETQAMEKITDEPSRLLMEAHDLMDSLSTAFKNLNISEEQICPQSDGTNDELELDCSLHIGTKSEQHLIEHKNIATEVGQGDSNSTKDLDFRPSVLQEVKNLSHIRTNEESMRKMGLLRELIAYLETEEGAKTLFSEPSSSTSEDDHLSSDALDLAKKGVKFEFTSAATESNLLTETNDAPKIGWWTNKVHTSTAVGSDTPKASVSDLPKIVWWSDVSTSAETAPSASNTSTAVGSDTPKASVRDLPKIVWWSDVSTSAETAPSASKDLSRTPGLYDDSTLPAVESDPPSKTHNLVEKTVRFDPISTTGGGPSSDAYNIAGNNLLRKYEEITEWRQAMRMLEGDDDDDPMRFLWDTGNFSSSFLTVLMNVIIIGQEICNDTERLRHEYEYDDSLIEVEGIATPTFPELESEPDDIIVTEEIVTETEPALSEEEEMRKLIVKKDQFEKQLDSMVEIMTDLHNGREKQLDTSLVDE